MVWDLIPVVSNVLRKELQLVGLAMVALVEAIMVSTLFLSKYHFGPMILGTNFDLGILINFGNKYPGQISILRQLSI